MYPLKMTPEIKEIIWGGTKMREKYNKCFSFDKAGESWEVSTHPMGLSFIANGELSGMSLADAIRQFPDICGSVDYDFPLMFKIIDANNDLSIQVHPDDSYASEHENSPRGKTEMWYVIDCEEGSRIGYGFNRDMSAVEIRQAIDNGTLQDYIRYINVKKGEAYFIPAGTVHCLCSGLLIAELQQSSNVTYRLYDYNRKGPDGKLRELHIDKALDVIDYSNNAPSVVSSENSTVLAECDKFVCKMVKCNNWWDDNSACGYRILFFVEGEGLIRYSDGVEQFSPGDTFVIPKCLGEYSVEGIASFMMCFE